VDSVIYPYCRHRKQLGSQSIKQSRMVLYLAREEMEYYGFNLSAFFRVTGSDVGIFHFKKITQKSNIKLR
jgi:hypothetical protein